MSRGRELLRKQFIDGPLSADEDRELRDLLRASASLRTEYARWVELERAIEGRPVPKAQIERLLARGAPAPAEAEDPAFSAEDDANARVTPFPTPARWAAGVAALAAAAAVSLVVTRPADEGPRARSGGGDPGQTAWITAYQPAARAPADELQRVTDVARADRPFAFAYSNLKGSPYGFLAIAGRDAAGRVHWFHPAYTDANQTPESIAIQRGVADRELGELISVETATGSMELCGLFTERPLDVRTVDVALERGAPWPEEGLRDCRVLELRGAP